MAAGTMERDGKPKTPRPYERPRGGPARPVAELVPQIGRAAFRRFGFVQSSVLVVQPAHAPLIQHVIPEIIERVNRFFGYQAVAKVKMRQGEVKPPPGTDRAARESSGPSLKPIPLELGDSLRDIGDPELRAVLESLARSLGGTEEQGQG